MDPVEEEQRTEKTDEQLPVDAAARLNFVSRRTFLKATILTAAAGTGLVAAACAPQEPRTVNLPSLHPLEDKYPYVPAVPATPPDPNTLLFFTPDEAKLVDAITARLIPGTPEDPGAHEAGVVTFIDNLLTFNNGYDEPTYIMGPFMKTYEGTPPPEAATANPKETVYVEKTQAPRYGYQSKQTPQEQYRKGLASVDKFAQEKFGTKFVELSDAEKDEILKAMQEDSATGFDEPQAPGFFKLMLKHTGEGFFGDPAYGGNRGLAGWKLVSYPGAYRAYTEADLHNENFDVPLQSLKQLSPFHPGEHSTQRVILPAQSEDKYPNDEPSLNSLQQFLRWCGITR